MARGLCSGHRAQAARRGKLSPLRKGPALQVVALRVSAACRTAVLRWKDDAKRALEDWAARKIGGRP